MTEASSRARPWNPPDVFASSRPPPRIAMGAPVTGAVGGPVAAPSWTAADIAAAHEQGLHDGAQAAQRDALASIATTLQQIAATVSASAEASAISAQRSADALADVLVRGFVAAFPALEARFGGGEVGLLAAAILPGLAREPALTMRAASGAADALAAVLSRLPSAQQARISIEIDADLGDADLHVVWRDGAAIRDGTAIRDAVFAALDGLAMTERSDL